MIYSLHLILEMENLLIQKILISLINLFLLLIHLKKEILLIKI